MSAIISRQVSKHVANRANRMAILPVICGGAQYSRTSFAKNYHSEYESLKKEILENEKKENEKKFEKNLEKKIEKLKEAKEWDKIVKQNPNGWTLVSIISPITHLVCWGGFNFVTMGIFFPPVPVFTAIPYVASYSAIKEYKSLKIQAIGSVVAPITITASMFFIPYILTSYL